MKLIINADDFGYTKSICDGIVEGCQKGIIRSTSVLCNMPYLEYGAELTKQVPELGIGVHLTLTLGESLTRGKTITKDGLHFKDRIQFYEELNDLDLVEVYIEFKAQIEKFINIFHRFPDHLDSHHSVHHAGEILKVSMLLSEEYGLPMRHYNSFELINEFYGNHTTVHEFIHILDTHMNFENIEIMTHPGFCDLELYRQSSYHFGRLKELDVLCDEQIIHYLKEHSITLTNYKNQ